MMGMYVLGRGAFPGDYVHVAGQTGDQTVNDNADVAERKDSNYTTGKLSCPEELTTLSCIV